MKIYVKLDLNYNNLSNIDIRLLLQNCLNSGLNLLDENLNPILLNKSIDTVDNLNFNNFFVINVQFQGQVLELSFNKIETSLTIYSSIRYKNIAPLIDVTLKITKGFALHSLFSE